MNQTNPSIHHARHKCLLGNKEKRRRKRGGVSFMITSARLINVQKTYSFLLTALPIVRQKDAAKKIFVIVYSDNLFFTRFSAS